MFKVTSLLRSPSILYFATCVLNISNSASVNSLIFADDGDQIFCRLAPGEFAFYPSADNTKIQVKSSANTPSVEFLLLEVD